MSLFKFRWPIAATLFAAVLALTTVITPSAPSAPPTEPTATLLVSGLQGALGSTVGPDGALYVTESRLGRILRVDPQTGETTTFASGLPPRVLPGLGGAMDIAFIDDTAYVLVSLVSPDVGGHDVDGIYRVDGPESLTIIADIGEFALENPPETDFFIPTGVHFALEPYQGGLLVTDGHHNRVYGITLDGQIDEAIVFDNIVPTGLARWGNTIYMAEAGPLPHNPEDGKVTTFGPNLPVPVTIASGARLLVDVEFGSGRALYALSQGVWNEAREGSPAFPNTGSLVKANVDGTFITIMEKLDRPTSLEFIGNTAYVVNLAGQIWRIDGVSP